MPKLQADVVSTGGVLEIADKPPCRLALRHPFSGMRRGGLSLYNIVVVGRVVWVSVAAIMD